MFFFLRFIIVIKVFIFVDKLRTRIIVAILNLWATGLFCMNSIVSFIVYRLFYPYKAHTQNTVNMDMGALYQIHKKGSIWGHGDFAVCVCLCMSVYIILIKIHNSQDMFSNEQ